MLDRPNIASDIALTPQAKTVLLHLEKRDSISPREADVSYSITRLAARIHEIKKAGYRLRDELRIDGGGHRYKRYWLLKAVH